MSNYRNAAKYVTLPVKLVNGSGNCSRTTPTTTISCPVGHAVTVRHSRADCKAPPDGAVIEQTVSDDTLPNGHRQVARRYGSPFATANREAAWPFFARHGQDATCEFAAVGGET